MRNSLKKKKIIKGVFYVPFQINKEVELESISSVPSSLLFS